MKGNFILVFIVSLLVVNSTKAQFFDLFTKTASSNFTNSAHWVANICGGAGNQAIQTSDTINICSGRTANFVTNTIAKLETPNGQGGGTLTSTGGNLTITGDFVVNANLTITGTGTISIGGKLIIAPGISLSHSSAMVINVMGLANISGTFTGGGTGTINFNNGLNLLPGSLFNPASTGNITIFNNFDVQSATFNSGAKSYIFNGCSITANQTVTFNSAVTFTNTSTNYLTGANVLRLNNNVSGAGLLYQANNANLELGMATFSANINASELGNNIVFIGGSTFTLPAITYHNITWNRGNTSGLAGNIIVNGNLSISSGNFGTSGKNINIKGDFVNNAAFNAASGSVIFDGSGAEQQIAGTGSGSFYNLTVDGSASVATYKDVVINNDLNVYGLLAVGAFNFTSSNNAYIFTGAMLDLTSSFESYYFNNLVVDGDFMASSSVDVQIAGDLSCSGNFTSNSGTYNFTGFARSFSGAAYIQNIAINGTFTNNGTLYTDELSGFGSLTQGVSSSFSVSGTVSVGTLDASSNSNVFEYSGGSNQFIFGTNYSDLVLSGSGTKFQSYDMQVDDLQVNSTVTFEILGAYGLYINYNFYLDGIFTPATSYVVFQGPNCNISGSAASIDFYDLFCGIGTNLNLPGYEVNIYNSLSNDGSFYQGAGRVNIRGATTSVYGANEIIFTDIYIASGAQLLQGVNIGLSGLLENDGVWVPNTYNVTIYSNTALSGTQDITFYNLVISSSILTSTSGTLVIYNSFTNNWGDFTPNGGTVYFNGTNCTISATTNLHFYNLINTAEIIAPTIMHIHNSWNNVGGFNHNNSIVYIEDNVSYNGLDYLEFYHFEILGGGNFNCGVDSISVESQFGINGTWNANSNAWLIVNGNAMLSGSPLYLPNLKINTGYNCSNIGGNIVLGGDFICHGVYSDGSSALYFTNPAANFGGSNDDVYVYNIEVQGGAGLTVRAGQNIHVTGALLVQGTLYSNSNTFTFAGSGTFLGAGTINFYDLIFDIGSNITPGYATVFAVENNLNNNGTFNYNNSSLIANGGFTTINSSSDMYFENINISSGNSLTLNVSNLYVNNSIYNDGNIYPQTSIIHSNGPAVYFDGSAPFDLYDFQIDLGSTFTAPSTVSMFIYSSFIVEGNLIHNSGSVYFVGPTSYILGSVSPNFFNLIINSGTTLHANPSMNFMVSNNFENNGDFDHENSEVVFYGMPATISGTSPTVFYNITNYPGGYSLSFGDMEVEGTFWNDGDLYPNPGTTVSFDLFASLGGTSTSQFANVFVLNTGSLQLDNNITINENFTINGGFAHNNYLVSFNGASIVSDLSGTIYFNDVQVQSASSVSFAGSPYVYINNLENNGTFNGNGTVVELMGSPSVISGSDAPSFNILIIPFGLSLDITNTPALIQVGYQLLNSGTIQNGAVEFNGSGEYYDGSGSGVVDDIIISNTLILYANLEMTGNFTNNASFGYNGNDIVFSGTTSFASSSSLTDLGTVDVLTGAYVDFGYNLVNFSSNLNIDGAINTDPSSFINFIGYSPVQGTNASLPSLHIDGGATIEMPTGAITYNGDIYNDGNISYSSNSLAYLNGSSMVILGSGSTYFDELYVNSFANVSIATDMLIHLNGDLTNDGWLDTSGVFYTNSNINLFGTNPSIPSIYVDTDGSLTLPSGSNINVGRYFKIVGGFTHNNSTISMLGGEAAIYCANKNFYNLLINASSVCDFKNSKINIESNLYNFGTIVPSSSTVEFVSSLPMSLIGNTTDLFNVILNSTLDTGLYLNTQLNVSGTFNFNAGKVVSSSTAPLKFTSGGQSVPPGGKVGSYVTGPVIKESNGGTFVFPTGGSYHWGRLKINVVGGSADYYAEYRDSVPPNHTAMSTGGTPLDHVSTLEFWRLYKMSGPANTSVSMYFEDMDESGMVNCGDLRPAFYNGTDWENPFEGSHSIIGACSVGTDTGAVNSNANVANYGCFTFGTTTAVNPLNYAFYWTGNGGNWSDYIGHWSRSSGGPSNERPFSPRAYDRVYFDSNSFGGVGDVINMDVNGYCKDLYFDDVNTVPSIIGTGSLYVGQ